MITHKRFFRLGFLFCWFLTVGFGVSGQHKTALAATLPPGYSLSITESASTITYSGAIPDFHAQLTVPTGDNPLTNPGQFTFLIDSQAFAPTQSGFSGSGSLYTFGLRGTSVAPNLTPAVGQHSVVARYYSIVLKQTIESAPITLTVLKATPSVYCEITWANSFSPNAPATFTMTNAGGSGPIDWQNATYSVTFTGPQTFTRSNLTVNSSGQGTVAMPPAPGMYKYDCVFHGTGTFNSADSGPSSSTLLVSASRQPSIKMYTNPTTIKGGDAATLEVVVSGAPGSPAPTGQINLSLGNLFTKPVNLGPGGAVTITITFPSALPANTIWVDYFGDTAYASANVGFSLTNPPIPTGGNQPAPAPVNLGTKGNTPAATPTATSTPTATATDTPVTTVTPTSTALSAGDATSGHNSANSSSSQGKSVFWIALVVLLVLFAGGAGALIVRRKRAGQALP